MAAEADVQMQRILAVVDSIPKGQVATYGQVAEEAGLPRRARLVGRILSELSTSTELPWHRVVASPGRISPRPGRGAIEQAKRLRAEGVPVKSGRLDLKKFRWQAE